MLAEHMEQEVNDAPIKSENDTDESAAKPYNEMGRPLL
jgi:hypothetical protein